MALLACRHQTNHRNPRHREPNCALEAFSVIRANPSLILLDVAAMLCLQLLALSIHNANQPARGRKMSLWGTKSAERFTLGVSKRRCTPWALFDYRMLIFRKASHLHHPRDTLAIAAFGRRVVSPRCGVSITKRMHSPLIANYPFTAPIAKPLTKSF